MTDKMLDWSKKDERVPLKLMQRRKRENKESKERRKNFNWQMLLWISMTD